MEVGWWALIVSALSFGIVALTYWRNRTRVPRWEISWDHGDAEGGDLLTDSIRCIAINRGRGEARDVILSTVDLDGRKDGSSDRAAVRAFGESVELWFSFEDGASSESGGFRTGEIVLHNPEHGTARFAGQQARETIVVELKWHQEPSLHKLRKKGSGYRRPLLAS